MIHDKIRYHHSQISMFSASEQLLLIDSRTLIQACKCGLKCVKLYILENTFISVMEVYHIPSCFNVKNIHLICNSLFYRRVQFLIHSTQIIIKKLVYSVIHYKNVTITLVLQIDVHICM